MILRDKNIIIKFNYDDLNFFKESHINIPTKEEIICVKPYIRVNKYF